MAQCVFTKPDSSRCGARAMADSLLCFQHAPEVAEERHRSHVKGGKTGGRGRSKGGSELSWIKQQLKTTAENVLEGTLDSRRGAVVAQLLTAYRAAIETELRVQEQRELEERLEELERHVPEKNRRRFG